MSAPRTPRRLAPIVFARNVFARAVLARAVCAPGILARALLVLSLLALGLAPARLEAREGGMGPGAPVWPRPGQKDRQLYDKAVRLQAGMWWHISPEGVLVYRHRLGATSAQLSHDALALSDVAIWTGCYAASQACRWHVTRDPDALAQAKTLARGLAMLSEVTGKYGGLTRNVGRLIPGEPVPPAVIPSPTGSGLHFHPDVSRDQLQGVTFGWACLARYVEDPEVQELARHYGGRLGVQLYADGLWLRNYKGEKTEFGEFRPDVEFVPFRKNGSLAAMGLAPVVLAQALDPQLQLAEPLRAMAKDGWVRALPQQNVMVASLVNQVNVNITMLGLTTLCLYGDDFTRSKAMDGLGNLRRATRGWWNGGFCAMLLLSAWPDDRPGVLGELRASLHDMTDLEVPPGSEENLDLNEIVPVAQKGSQEWTWADNVRRMRRYHPWPNGVSPITYTRADYLFAYWLGRAAGEMRPLVGPGAEPTADRVRVNYPPWMPGQAAEAAQEAPSR